MGWRTSKFPGGNTTSPPRSGKRSSVRWISALVTPAGKVMITGFRTGIWGATTPAVEKTTKQTHNVFFAAFNPLI
jgi:hypothetical protein